jgi:hypothetical protein
MRIIFSIFIIFGVLAFIINIALSDEHDADCGCFEWEYTKGIIINNYVSVQQMIHENGDRYIMYRPDIIYEYVVANIKYTGESRGRYKTSNVEKHIVEKYLENYAIDKTIKVEYDKNQPENSSMFFENENKLLYNSISLSLILIGIGGLVLYKIKRKKKC